MNLPKLGIHTNLSYAQYAADPGIRATQLKDFDKSDMHAHHKRLHPKSGAAMNLGIATHTYVLEPDRFDDEYAVAPKVDRRTNDGKARWLAFEESSGNKTVLSDGDCHNVKGMGNSALRHGDARALLVESKGVNEVTIFWELEGVRCKARIDRLCSWNGIPTAVDLKSTSDSGPWGFDRSIRKFGYHLQAAWYLMGLQALSPAARQFVIVAVESAEPWVPAVYTFDDEYISIGSKLALGAFNRLREAEKTGVWAGYKTQVMYAPDWMINKHLEEKEGGF